MKKCVLNPLHHPLYTEENPCVSLCNFLYINKHTCVYPVCFNTIGIMLSHGQMTCVFTQSYTTAFCADMYRLGFYF